MSASPRKRTTRRSSRSVRFVPTAVIAAIRLMGHYGMFQPGSHSGLMPADLITLAHLSIWLAMNFPNSADLNDIG
jgi:ABC-type transport system involved in cytochrome c biogenesis permease subunit